MLGARNCYRIVSYESSSRRGSSLQSISSRGEWITTPVPALRPLRDTLPLLRRIMASPIEPARPLRNAKKAIPALPMTNRLAHLRDFLMLAPWCLKLLRDLRKDRVAWLLCEVVIPRLGDLPGSCRRTNGRRRNTHRRCSCLLAMLATR